MKFSLNLLLLSTFFILNGCTKKEVEKESAFVKIYDNPGFSEKYIPLDIKQRSDGSYVVLAKLKITTSSFFGAYILWADKNGKFLNENLIPSPNVNPVGQLLQSGDSLYFVCMEDVSYKAKLFKISSDGTTREVAFLANAGYPLCAALTNDKNGFLLLSYNSSEFKSIVSSYDLNGNPPEANASNSFDIGAGEYDPIGDINGHFTGTGKQLPFFIGQTLNNSIYFNGFYNYTFSLLFLKTDKTYAGVFQGYRSERYVTSLANLTGNDFFLSRFGSDVKDSLSSNDNFIIPKLNINTEGTSSSDASGGNLTPEIANASSVIVKKMTLEGKNVVIYGTTTKSNQIVLYAYDETSGSLLGSKHIGFSFPLQLGGFILNNDQTITAVVTNYVAGRFPRITLIKLSKTDIKSLLGEKQD